MFIYLFILFYYHHYTALICADNIWASSNIICDCEWDAIKAMRGNVARMSRDLDRDAV